MKYFVVQTESPVDRTIGASAKVKKSDIVSPTKPNSKRKLSSSESDSDSRFENFNLKV